MASPLQTTTIVTFGASTGKLLAWRDTMSGMEIQIKNLETKLEQQHKDHRDHINWIFENLHKQNREIAEIGQGRLKHELSKIWEGFSKKIDKLKSESIKEMETMRNDMLERKRRREEEEEVQVETQEQLQVEPTKRSRTEKEVQRILCTPATIREGRSLCVYCRERHYSDECYGIVDIETRKEIVKNSNRCKRCLGDKQNHTTCNKKCHYCDSRNHHSSLCPKPENQFTS
ncbi:unnamed protein product [Caenorhabditis angaria]|uniref:CCHC-type domain-containing protein n=1 Tax=Caenorhabditis angaria TaxID=860376 RepID=A0A9P1IC85_9PELO|nr:unnamed protein product [Caenorhabditis angaria]